MTQTVPDISPLMPMHEDPLLVICDISPNPTKHISLFTCHNSHPGYRHSATRSTVEIIPGWEPVNTRLPALQPQLSAHAPITWHAHTITMAYRYIWYRSWVYSINISIFSNAFCKMRITVCWTLIGFCSSRRETRQETYTFSYLVRLILDALR